jgi:AcrR family transcriptional regulator
MAETVARTKMRDSVRTKGRILAAAQHVFSSLDYSRARLSDVAALAGVNQALVVRYFGPKERLFEAALEGILADIEPKARLTIRSPTFGRDIATYLMDGEPGRPEPLPMMIHATSDPTAKAIALRLMKSHIVHPLAEWLGPPDGETRVTEVLAICAGFFTYSRLLPLRAFSEEANADVRTWLAETLQSIWDGSKMPTAHKEKDTTDA